MSGLAYIGDTGTFPAPREPQPPERGMATALIYRALYDRDSGAEVVAIPMEAHERMVERAEAIFAEWIEQGLVEVTPLGGYTFGLRRNRGIG